MLFQILGLYCGGYEKTTWAFIGKLSPASSQGHDGKSIEGEKKSFVVEDRIEPKRHWQMKHDDIFFSAYVVVWEKERLLLYERKVISRKILWKSLKNGFDFHFA